MNTKQVEELTGISRQNIRYYERMGLLHPARSNENSYRDYTKEDVEQLQMIKMLRMLDMPIEEIQSVLENGTIQDAIKNQRVVLQSKKKELQAAVIMCDRIMKADHPEQQVEQFLYEIEYMQTKDGGFAQFMNDYKQVAYAAKQRQFSFYVYRTLHKEQDVWEELEGYAKENDLKLKRISNNPLIVRVEDTEYNVCIMHTRMFKEKIPATIILCKMADPSQALDAKIPHNRRKIIQGIYEVFRNFERRKWKSILVTAICMMAVCFMESFFGNVESHKSQLAKLPEIYEITGSVNNPDGSLNKGIIISEDLIKAITDSPYIDSYKETIELNAILNQGKDNEEKLQIQGVNTLEAVTELKMDQIHWQQGMESQTFLTASNGCIIDNKYMEEQRLQLGDEITVLPQYYDISAKDEYSFFLTDLQPVTIKIVGSAQLTDMLAICPQTLVKEWFTRSGKEYKANSLTFVLKKPYEINLFKQQMKKAGLNEINSKSRQSYKGSALVVEDVDYITAATSLRKSIGFLTGFYPVLLTLILLMGYMVSWLLLQSRRLEVAIMKSLGKDNRHIARQFYMEHIILALCGCIVGMIIGLIMGWGSLTTMLLVMGLFLVCYSVGTIISLWMIRKLSVMAMLSAKE